MTLYEIKRDAIFCEMKLKQHEKKYFEAVENNWQYIFVKEKKQIERLKKHIQFLEEQASVMQTK